MPGFIVEPTVGHLPKEMSSVAPLTQTDEAEEYELEARQEHGSEHDSSAILYS